MIDIAEIVIEPSEDYYDVNERLYALGVTDGLPIVPPTKNRLEAMLGNRDPGKVVGRLPAQLFQTSLNRLAVCAVMAGCRPEYFPVLMAAIEAIAQPEFNLLGIQTTTGTAAPLMIVNGPIINEIGLNAGCNALGPGVRSNATIGRALTLALRNIGGAIPGQIDLSTMGQPGKYLFCFAENESANPWEPLHVSRGFNKKISTVTVVGAAGTLEVKDDRSTSADNLLKTFAHSMLSAGSLGGGNLLSGGEPLFLISPEHVRIIAGKMTRREAQICLFEEARLSIDALSTEVADFVRQTRSHLGNLDEDLRVSSQPSDIMLVVVGGVGIKSTYIPTWGGTTKAVTRPIT